METGVKEGGERVCKERILAPETGHVGEPLFCRRGGAKGVVCICY